MKLLPAIGLTIAGIFLLQKLTTASVAARLNLFITSFNFTFSGITPIITLGVTAQNVTNDSLQFNALAANAFLNGNLIGNVSGFVPVTIAAQSQMVVPLKVVINAGALITDVANILSGSAGVSAVLELVGNANVSNLVIPVDLTYKAI